MKRAGIKKKPRALLIKLMPWPSKKKNWKEAIIIWTELAKEGYIRSAFYVGVGFDSGYGVRQESPIDGQNIG